MTGSALLEMSLAFLNSKLDDDDDDDDDDIALLEPPSTLRRMGLVKPNVLRELASSSMD